MSDLRDTRSGTYDDISPEGRQQPDQVRDRETAHERAQVGADVRADPLPGVAGATPEGLLRPGKGPLNPREGRGNHARPRDDGKEDAT